VLFRAAKVVGATLSVGFLVCYGSRPW